MNLRTTFRVHDQFCGAGGSSLGIRNLSQKYGGGIEVSLAMNHWRLAVETHSTNFPETDHDCADISQRIRDVTGADMMITSPECTIIRSPRVWRANISKQKIFSVIFV